MSLITENDFPNWTKIYEGYMGDSNTSYTVPEQVWYNHLKIVVELQGLYDSGSMRASSEKVVIEKTIPASLVTYFGEVFGDGRDVFDTDSILRMPFYLEAMDGPIWYRFYFILGYITDRVEYGRKYANRWIKTVDLHQVRAIVPRVSGSQKLEVFYVNNYQNTLADFVYPVPIMYSGMTLRKADMPDTTAIIPFYFTFTGKNSGGTTRCTDAMFSEVPRDIVFGEEEFDLFNYISPYPIYETCDIPIFSYDSVTATNKIIMTHPSRGLVNSLTLDANIANLVYTLGAELEVSLYLLDDGEEKTTPTYTTTVSVDHQYVFRLGQSSTILTIGQANLESDIFESEQYFRITRKGDIVHNIKVGDVFFGFGRDSNLTTPKRIILDVKLIKRMTNHSSWINNAPKIFKSIRMKTLGASIDTLVCTPDDYTMRYSYPSTIEPSNGRGTIQIDTHRTYGAGIGNSPLQTLNYDFDYKWSLYNIVS